MTTLRNGTLLLTVTLCATLAGCTGLKPSEDKKASQQTEAPPTASFTPDTLYALLLAELANKQQRFDIGLGNYLREAQKTKDPGVAERAYQIAQYIGAKQAALQAASLWSETDPANTRALQAKAIHLSYNGQFEAALQAMLESLALDGETHFDFIALNAAELPSSERTKLIAMFNQALAQHPENTQLRFAKALLLEQNEQYQQSLELVDEVLDDSKPSPKVINLKGRLLIHLKQYEEAENYLAKAIKSHKEDVRLRLLYARTLIHQKKLEDAQTQFTELQKLSPNDSKIIFSLGLITLENEMYEKAASYFKQLQSDKQLSNAANYYLGRIAEEQKQFDKAIQFYTKVEPSQEFSQAYYQLALILLEQKQTKAITDYFNQARKDFPKLSAQLYMIEAEAYSNQQAYPEAKQTLDQALQTEPNHINLRYARAMVAEKMGNLDLLESDLRSIIKLDPNNALALNALGYTLANKTSRLQEAKKLIEQAYSITPNDPAVIDSLGWVEFRLGNHQQALTLLRKAFAAFPDHEVAAHLGEVLWVLGKKQEALDVWQKALQEKPDSEILQRTMQRLNVQKP
ncbi:tetratricopeptide repeat protein [Zooshikella ganghwensis]|uniref:Tetratricopeptide repeat protein n=1 Tax=Zooshikella ganghwensis TaxID=202772 RepID=A0A4P9VSK7_9GAMM|nr:tetratricopeptide repeat protein [Zooshikella ganghwensis]RDH45657.1 tetratricopeptide repeat protein [Zooshikella ganghwensis]